MNTIETKTDTGILYHQTHINILLSYNIEVAIFLSEFNLTCNVLKKSVLVQIRQASNSQNQKKPAFSKSWF
jgi:hypothetical protein